MPDTSGPLEKFEIGAPHEAKSRQIPAFESTGRPFWLQNPKFRFKFGARASFKKLFQNFSSIRTRYYRVFDRHIKYLGCPTPLTHSKNSTSELHKAKIPPNPRLCACWSNTLIQFSLHVELRCRFFRVVQSCRVSAIFYLRVKDIIIAGSY